MGWLKEIIDKIKIGGTKDEFQSQPNATGPTPAHLLDLEFLIGVSVIHSIVAQVGVTTLAKEHWYNQKTLAQATFCLIKTLVEHSQYPRNWAQKCIYPPSLGRLFLIQRYQVDTIKSEVQ